ncbi:phosphotransferase [Hymenobacter sp. BT175]|uniref:phosphotransferase n=1 Tax=Hymenobacter translucens TaxID=2886507 RepID=UPI001D0EE3B8|nr:phosphotransferase [Hymenobacter translucens]MCC2548866.1 phosphotransferase [Hymenobacter translucens]
MFLSDYLSPAFLETIMQEHAPHRRIRVEQVELLPVDNSSSILTILTAGQTEKPVGHFGLSVTMQVDGTRHTKRLVLKLKPNGREISAMLGGLAQACGGVVAATYPAYEALTGFEHTHWRELRAYEETSALLPEVWATHANEADQTYVVLMEYLEDVELLNSVMAPEQWTDEHIRTALTQLADWHADHLVAGYLRLKYYGEDVPSGEFMQRMAPLWTALLTNAATHLPTQYGPEREILLRRAIAGIPTYWSELEDMPKTLIHNDLNPRNTCFKRNAAGELQFCAYDWELATYHVPQYDVAELLCFVLDADRYHLRPVYLEHYRQALHARTGQFADQAAFRRGFDLATVDFGLHRLGMYLMAHSLSPYPYLPRVIESFFNSLEQGQAEQSFQPKEYQMAG